MSILLFFVVLDVFFVRDNTKQSFINSYEPYCDIKHRPGIGRKFWNSVGSEKKPIELTGARGTDLPTPLFFSNFLFTNLFSRKFLNVL
jgi:hypothetical protein